MLEALVRDARVLVTTEVDGAVTVEIAHEALLREWTTLVRWLDADRGALKLRQELAQDAARGTSSEYLWGRSRVEEARRILDASTVELDATERGFLVASERAVRRRRRWVQGGVAALLATAAVVVAVVSAQRAEAVQERDRADEQTRLANAHAADAALQKTAAETARDRARDAAWIAYARMLHDKDPTRALAGLRNVQAKDSVGWLDEALYTLNEPLALVSLPGTDPAVSPDGARVLILPSANYNNVAVWNIDGSGEPVILRGHEEYVMAARFSPDGRHIVTASADRTVRVWNADGSGEPVVLRGHTARVNTVSISPDGQQILTSSLDGTARVWSTSGSGESIAFRHLSWTNNYTFEPRFSPDGRRILVRSSEKTASIHNADGSGGPVVLKGHQDFISSGRFSPDGRRVATASYDRTVRVWAPGETIVLRGHESFVLDVRFSPDGGRIVTASEDRTARVWTVDGRGDPVVLRHDSSPDSAAFSPDGRRIVTLADTKAYLWDASGSGTPVVFRGHEARVRSAHVTADGRYLVTDSRDETTRVWRADNRRRSVLAREEKWRARARFSPDGLRIVIASGTTGRVWNADGSGEPAVLENPGPDWIIDVYFSPDGKRLVFASSKKIQVRNADGSGEPMAVASDESGFLSVRPSPDGRRIVTTSKDAVRVWDLEGMRAPVALRGHGNTFTSAAFGPDSQRVVTVSEDCTVRVWNADGSDQPEILANRAPHESSCGEYGVGWATFSPDGRRIAAGTPDAVWVWNAGSPGAPRVFTGASYPRNLNFSPDGRRILCSSWSVGLLWDLEGFDEPVKLTGHTGDIYTTTFSPDGRHVLTASEDGTARVWNLDGSAAVVLRGHTGDVWSARFSPDGQRAVTTGIDGTVRVWDLDPAVVQARVAEATTLCVPYRDRVQFVGEQPQEACAAFLACERAAGRQSSCE